MSPCDAPDADSALPDIDDRLVTPGTPYEMYDGELVRVSPADPPHGELQLQLCALLEAHTGYDFQAACDLLTRTSRVDDIAPDASVYPAARHPQTGRRQLEQLAFEVVSTESIAKASRKAAKLAGRGVRRVFAIDIERSRVLEWSAAAASWTELDPAGHIEDPALEVPLPIDAMLHAAKADDAIARALIARHNPVLEAWAERDRAEGEDAGFARGRAEGEDAGFARGRAEGEDAGFARGLAEAVLAALAARGVSVGPTERARILAERDTARLTGWVARAATCTAIGELFAAT